MHDMLAARLAQLSPAKRELLEKRLHGTVIPAAPAAIPRRQAADTAPLSFAQQRLWFLHQLEPTSAVYNGSWAFQLSGPLDELALQRSFATIIQRHEALRTTFPAIAGQPQQQIAPTLELPWTVIDLQTEPAATRMEVAGRLIRDVGQQPFDLAAGPLLRIILVRLAPDEHLFGLILHHIVCDEWSLQVLFRELSTAYAGYAGAQPLNLPPLPIQYADVAVWQREQLHGDRLTKQLAYWKTHLGADVPALNLPTDYPRPPVQTFHGARHLFRLSAAQSADLKAFCQQEQVTLFMTLLAGFNVLLHRYSNQTEIVVGSPMANRTRTEIERLIGLFFNTLVLKSQLGGSASFRQVLKQMREVALEAFSNQELPFEKLVEELQPVRDPSRNPLFQVLFDWHNEGAARPTLAGINVRPIERDEETSKLDLSLTMWEADGVLVGEILYNIHLFKATTIERLAGHFQTLLAGAVADPTLAIGALTVLAEAEYTELIVTRNRTAAEYPREVCLHQLIERQVARTPETCAVIFGDQTLTYAELNARANQLAHYLQAQGVGTDSRVGLCLERSLDLPVAVLAILKAGAAFVPLDPSFPGERMAYIMDDSAVRIVLSDARTQSRLPATVHALCLDTGSAAWAAAPTTNPSPAVSGDHLAYLIYTSGSTGKPKGVLIPHQGIVNYVDWCAKTYGAATGRGAPVHASIAADAIFPGLFAPLCVGSSVLIFPEDQPLQALAHSLVADGNFSFVKITPSQLEVLEQYLPPEDASAWVHMLVIGAEAVRSEVLRFWQQHAPTVPLLNEYGPTETVVGCSIYTFPPDAHFTGAAPLGLPIANLQFYVLDAWMQPVPIGVSGELYIGGDGVAWGYHNRPTLTAEKFVPDPFSAQPGARLYRSGDVARYLEDAAANIAFLGRSDDQIKIRGYRVELGEIEAALDRHPGVREVVVLARAVHTGENGVVAYVVPDDTSLTVAQLRQFLQITLPEYMIPSAFVFLNAIPLAPHGKIDRNALPAPELSRDNLDTAHVAPRTSVETTLAEVWSDVLGIPMVGVYDNFFELGGHSLLAIQVIARIRAALQIDLAVRSFFESPTIAGLAEILWQSQLGQAAEIALDDLLAELTEIEQLSTQDIRTELGQQMLSSEEL